MTRADRDSKPAESDGSASGRSLWRFWGPRYWPVWLLIAWLRLTSWLPWRLAIALHRLLGRAGLALMRRHRQVVRRNLELSFPELDSTSLSNLVRLNFENLGACVAELTFAWFGKVDRSLAHFEIEGREHVEAALAKGNGVILYTGHFTPIEICAPVLKEIFPLFGFMFHPRRNALLSEIQRRGRKHSGHLCFPSDNVRAMLRALRQNAVVWYAPDQNFSSRSSIVLPFFGEPATVSTATCRLARASGAPIVPFFYRRLPDDSGYLMRFEPEVENIDNEDDTACTRGLLSILERFIRECPEQYVWTHRRLKHRAAQLGGSDESGPTSADAGEGAESNKQNGPPGALLRQAGR